MEKLQFSEDEKVEIIKYGIERCKMIIISITITLLLGCFFGILYQSIIFLLAFSILRRYAGGYHADTQLRCYVISLIIVILSFFCIKHIYFNNIISFLNLSLSLVIILFLSPIDSENRRLDEKEKQKYGLRTRITATILYLFCCYLYYIEIPNILMPIIVAYSIVAISLIAGCVKNIQR